MNASIARGWRFLAGLVLALALLPAARAGLITGSWDPAFGSPLPNLGWQVKAEVLVPNACSNQPDHVYSTASGPCSNAGPDFQFLSVSLRLFDLTLSTPNPGSWPYYDGYSAYATWTNAFTASQVRVQNGQIVGFETGSALAETLFYDPYTGPYSNIAASEANLFALRFTLNGPQLTCLGCVASASTRFSDPDNEDERLNVVSSAADLQQFLVTYISDDTSRPKFVDEAGNAAGSRLDNTGAVIGFSRSASGPLLTSVSQVPEPGMLLLVASALGGLALSRRPSARRAAPRG